jgi:hypothetical protein
MATNNNWDLPTARATLLEDQRYLQEKFWRYRNGDESYSKTKEDIKADYYQGGNDRRLGQQYWRASMARAVPRVSYGGQSKPAKMLSRMATARSNRIAHLPPDAYLRRGFNLGYCAQATAEVEFQRAAAFMTVRRSFHFIKVLGAGGNGIAVLFRWTPGGDPQAEGLNVVMKFSIDIDDNGAVEWDDIHGEYVKSLVSGDILKSTPFLISGLSCSKFTFIVRRWFGHRT